MLLRILAAAILTEAIIELIYKAEPLQGIRRRLIKWSPFLNTRAQGHPLNCKYCTSVWIGIMVVAAATYADSAATRLLAGAIIVARVSNYLHILIAWARDAQINLRLDR